MSSLCRTCMTTKSFKVCRHSDEERMFTDSYTLPEVAFAVEMGYTIVEIHEVWAFRQQAPIFQDL